MVCQLGILSEQTAPYQRPLFITYFERSVSANITGDELHVLTECNNVTLTKLRTKFFVKLLSISPQLKLRSSKSLLSYILSMCDVSICNVVSKFCFEVFRNY